MERDEESLWAYVIRTVRPLRRDRPVPATVEPKRVPPPVARHNDPPLISSRPLAVELTTNPGLDRRSDDRLRRGKMPIEARLDLHGMGVAQAQPELRRFVLQAQASGLRCVLVITGKGRMGEGVLRQSLPDWLAEAPLRPLILRYYPAQPKDGGSGAFYILLRRTRD